MDSLVDLTNGAIGVMRGTGKKCSICGQSRSVIEHKEYDFGQWFIGRLYSCSREGCDQEVCTQCLHDHCYEGLIKEKNLPKFHTFVTVTSCGDKHKVATLEGMFVRDPESNLDPHAIKYAALLVFLFLKVILFSFIAPEASRSAIAFTQFTGDAIALFGLLGGLYETGNAAIPEYIFHFGLGMVCTYTLRMMVFYDALFDPIEEPFQQYGLVRLFLVTCSMIPLILSIGEKRDPLIIVRAVLSLACVLFIPEAFRTLGLYYFAAFYASALTVALAALFIIKAAEDNIRYRIIEDTRFLLISRQTILLILSIAYLQLVIPFICRGFVVNPEVSIFFGWTLSYALGMEPFLTRIISHCTRIFIGKPSKLILYNIFSAYVAQ